MALEGTPNTLIVKQVERTWRATIETPRSGAYSLTIHREKCLVDGDGNVLGSPEQLPAIMLTLSTVKDDIFAVGDASFTVAQLAPALAAYFDEKVAQEAARVAAAAVAEVEPAAEPVSES